MIRSEVVLRSFRLHSRQLEREAYWSTSESTRLVSRVRPNELTIRYFLSQSSLVFQSGSSSGEFAACT